MPRVVPSLSLAQNVKRTVEYAGHAWKQMVSHFSVGQGGRDSEVANVLLGHNVQPPARTTRNYLEQYSKMPWLRAVCHRIAFAVASNPWEVHALRAPQGSGRMMPRAVDKRLKSASIQAREQRLAELRSTNEVEVLDQHPILDLLDFTNGFFTGLTSRMLVQIYLDIVGEAFLLMERNDATGQPVAIWPLPPYWVRDTPDPTRPYFEVQFQSSQFQIPFTEIIWMYHPRPEMPYGRGSGMMESLGDELETDELTAKYLRQFFYNGARPDTIVSLVGTKDATVERAERHWAQSHQGFWRAYKPFFTSRAIDVKVLGMQHEQMQLVPLRTHQRNTILQVVGVPPEILGIIENSNRSTIESADFLFSKYVVLPRLELQREVYQEMLVPNFGDNLYLGFCNPVEGDKEYHLRAAQAAPHTLRVDEWRMLQGLPPLDDDQGQVFVVAPGLRAVTSLDELSSPTLLQDSLLTEDTLVPEEEQSASLSLPGSRAESPFIIRRRRTDSSPLCHPGRWDRQLASDPELSLCLSPVEHQAALGHGLLRTQHALSSPACFKNYFVSLAPPYVSRIAAVEAESFEEGVEIVADRFKDKLSRTFTRFVRRRVKDMDEEVLQGFLHRRDINGAIRELYNPAGYSELRKDFAFHFESLVSLSGETAARVLNETFGFESEYDPNGLRSVRLVDDLADGLVIGLSESAGQALEIRLRELLEMEGLDLGEKSAIAKNYQGLTSTQMRQLTRFNLSLVEQDIALDKRLKRMSKLADAMRGRRGQVIGATDSITAANLAQEEMVQQAVDARLLPYTLLREWVCVDDDRLDTAVCEPMDGQRVKLNQMFTTGDGRQVRSPTAHPLCRCKVRVVIDTE